jgi:hypothetical protein
LISRENIKTFSEPLWKHHMAEAISLLTQSPVRYTAPRRYRAPGCNCNHGFRRNLDMLINRHIRKHVTSIPGQQLAQCSGKPAGRTEHSHSTTATKTTINTSEHKSTQIKCRMECPQQQQQSLLVPSRLGQTRDETHRSRKTETKTKVKKKGPLLD